jgi:hypothetical protein
MAKKKLTGAVHIAGKWYQAGDEVPDDVAAQITNPKLWASAGGDDEGGAGTAAVPTEPGTTSGARLASRVSVAGRWYGPYDPIPDDVAAQITNPKAWEGGKLPSLQESVPSGEREVTAGAVTAERSADADTADATSAPADMAAEPDTDNASAAAEKPTRVGRSSSSAKRGG